MHTTFTAIATVGLLQNSGFRISTDLITSVNTFANLALTTAARNCLASTGGQTVAVRNAIYNIPGFLTGIVGNISTYTTDQAIANSINATNIVGNILTQANTVFGTGSFNFVNTISRAKSFADTSYDLHLTANILANTSIDDFGIVVNNYRDILTAGVTSQFLNEGSINSTGFKELAAQLGNFGTMFNIDNLLEISKPYVLCLHLLDQGFTIIGDSLINRGINIANIADANESTILLALGDITDNVLNSIVIGTEFNSYQPLNSLADVFNSSKLFSPIALRVAGGSLSALENKFINLGGRFKSFSELKQFLLSVDASVNVSQFDQLTSQALSVMIAPIKTMIGNGAGKYGNPTVYDIIGSVSGKNYASKINSMIEYQTAIVVTAAGQHLANAITNANTLSPGDPVGIQAAANIVAATNQITTAHSSVVGLGNNVFSQLCSTFIQEKKNYILIESSLDDTDTSISTINSFASELTQVHSDPKSLLYGQYIKDVTDTNMYGQAIKSAVIEGYNLSLASSHSIPVYTVLNTAV